MITRCTIDGYDWVIVARDSELAALLHGAHVKVAHPDLARAVREHPAGRRR